MPAVSAYVAIPAVTAYVDIPAVFAYPVLLSTDSNAKLLPYRCMRCI
jgi:hypothetical protein